MGYRTLFYAAFFCAYACCLSSGTIQPARDPSRGLAGSRTRLEKSRVGSNLQPPREALFPGLDPGCDPSVCIPPSIADRTAGAPRSDCRSCDCKATEEGQRSAFRLTKTAFLHLVEQMLNEPHTPPGACIASFLPVASSPPVPVSVATGGIGRRPSVPVSSSSVSVAVLIAAPTVSVCRRVPSIMRHLVRRLRGGKEQNVRRLQQTHLNRIIRQVGHFDLICLTTPNLIRVVWCHSKRGNHPNTGPTVNVSGKQVV